MKIFISWSGEKSKEIATFLKSWIEQVIQVAEPWISVDIEKGKRWDSAISGKLEHSKVGIFCITKDNLNSPWLLFEAGAISKSVDSHVCTFLVDVNPTDLTEPLSLFQATKFNKEDVLKLLFSINQAIKKTGGKNLTAENLKELFEIFYPKLEVKLQEILSSYSTTMNDDSVIRSERELLEESVELLRQIKQTNLADPLKSEASGLLKYYAIQYGNTIGVDHDEVGNSQHIDEFMKRIQNNPLLLKVYGGVSGLRSFVSYEFDSLPF